MRSTLLLALCCSLAWPASARAQAGGVPVVPPLARGSAQEDAPAGRLLPTAPEGRTRVVIFESTPARLAGRVHFPPPVLTPRTSPTGESFTQVAIPGTDGLDGIPGEPAVPVFRRLVGVPRGAEVSIQVVPHVSGALALHLWPFQDLPENTSCQSYVDDFGDAEPPLCTYEDYPFAVDDATYALDGFLPAAPAAVHEVGTSRDLRVAQIAIAAASYNPAQDRLVLYRAVDFVVDFTGGGTAFVTQAALGPFEDVGRVRDALLNADIVCDDPEPLGVDPLAVGAELLILTPPALRSAADQLAQWKNQKGIPTLVRDVMDGAAGPGPDSPLDIRSFLITLFNESAVRPTYVLLLGDVTFTPTWYLQRLNKPIGTWIATDFPYAIVGAYQLDFLPDYVVGRIPAGSENEALVVVNKIIAYESGSPAVPTFYERATIASGFECCDLTQPDGTATRNTIRTSEWVRSALTGEGYAVDRIYGEYIDQDYTGDPTPRFFTDGAPLPASLDPSSGFAWDGSGSDVVAAFHDGRFFVMHLSHGSRMGWARPYFQTSHVFALANGDLLPMVFSLNCSTGYFDAETDGDSGTNGTCLAELLLGWSNGGALGVMASTRMANNLHTEAIARGIVDAIWPATIADFGPAQSRRRLGDIVDQAKLYQLALYGGDHWNARNHMWLYHAIGDPTAEMWTADPQQHLLPTFASASTFPDRVVVDYASEGAILTAWQRLADGSARPIGRAPVVGGQATIPYFVQPFTGVPLRVSASAENAVGLPLL